MVIGASLSKPMQPTRYRRVSINNGPSIGTAIKEALATTIVPTKNYVRRTLAGRLTQRNYASQLVFLIRSLYMKFHAFRFKPVTLAVLTSLAAMATSSAFAGTVTGWGDSLASGVSRDGTNIYGDNNTVNATATVIGDSNVAKASATMIGNNQYNDVTGSVLIGNGAQVSSTADGYSGDLAAVAIGASSSAKQNSVAIGPHANASYADATAIGANARASLNGVAIGTNAWGGDYSATALGAGSYADSYSTALGTNARALDRSLVVGIGASGSSSSLVVGNGASGSGSSTVLGNHASAGSSDAPIAIGEGSYAGAYGAIATGWSAQANSPNSIALGTRTQVTGDSSIAIGRYINVSGNNMVVIGGSAVGADSYAVALGNEAKALKFSAVALGGSAQATDKFTLALGAESNASGWYSVAAGGFSRSEGEQSAAFGNGSYAQNIKSLALGSGAQSYGVNSVALGANSNDYGLDNVVSVGGDFGYSRRIIGVASGVGDTDAVNMSQLNAVSAQVAQNTANISAMQGGVRATFVGAPLHVSADVSEVGTPSLVGATSNVGAAPVVALSGGSSSFFAADGDSSEVAIASAAHSLAVGANAHASADGSIALGANSVADRVNTVSVGSAESARQIKNVATGTQGTDAVNVDQLNGAVTSAVKQADSYTDNAIAGANVYTDRAVADAKNEMKHYSDRAAASTLAIPSIPMLNTGEKWVGAAVGNYGTSTAVGVAAAYQATTNLNVGVAVSSASGGPVALKAQAGYRW